jgi:hypothetical protein
MYLILKTVNTVKQRWFLSKDKPTTKSNEIYVR